ncbi:hypothetical protein, partial [Vibrio mexicanus]|uniref:hypothetical protein n=1 Tax=Vibrio mexicanus TaxID=1004326 RepID=UPI00063C0D72
MSVDDDVITVRKANHNARKWSLLPLFFVSLLITLKLLHEFGPSSHEIRYANSIVEASSNPEIPYTKAIGDDYIHALVNEKGKTSWGRYIKAVYMHGTEGLKKSLTYTLSFISIALFITLLLGRALIKYPRYAEVYFDRKRGIVYTWHEAKLP